MIPSQIKKFVIRAGMHILFVSLFFMAAAPGEAQPIYVDVNAGGAATGNNWADAYTNLQDALATAVPGNQIWVATGVYYPDIGGGQADNDRSATFAIPNGVGVYGGFAGGEALLGERNWTANVTVLSGDIDNNDATGAYDVTEHYSDIAGNNSYHVVDTGAATGALDGFTITAGDASGPGDDGGGIFNDGGSPLLSNLRIIGNRANHYGGGLYNNGANASLTEVVFENNRGGNGGAMGSTGGSTVTLNDVFFLNNYANNDGGAINSLTGNCTVTNSAFIGNYANASVGAMSSIACTASVTNVLFSGNFGRNFTGAAHNGGGTVDYLNVTFSGNRTNGNGGALQNDNSSPAIDNCVFWNNQDVSGVGTASSSIYNANGGTAAVTNCLVQGSGGSGAWIPAVGTDSGNNLDEDPLFLNQVGPGAAPTDTGNYRLQAVSPAVDAGWNGPPLPGADLDGNPRIVNGTVDMGAYESSGFPEIDVRGNGISIPNGDATPIPGDNTDFGSTPTTGGTVVDLFVVHNTGPGVLHLVGTPVVELAIGTDFSVTALPDTEVASAGSSGFQITFDPTTDGIHNDTVSITNDDDDESPYSFDIQGTGTNTLPISDPGGPYVADEGGAVVLDGSGSSDIDGPIASYQWDFDGDGIFGETGAGALQGDETGMDPTFSATGINGPAVYPVFLRVTDSSAEYTENSVDITINNIVPSADAGGPYSIEEDGLIVLAATGTDPVDALTYEWDLDNDGTFGETGALAAQGDEDLQNPTFNAVGLAGPSTFPVTLRVNDGDANTDATVDITIIDDDIDYEITASVPTAAEGDAGNTLSVTFTVSRTGATFNAGSVEFQIVGAADFGSDYNNIGGTSGATGTAGVINFGVDVLSLTITLDILGDFVDELDETVTVELFNPTAPGTATFTNPLATTTILDDDTAGITVGTANADTTEAGGTANFTVVLDSEPAAGVAIAVSSSDTTEGTVAPASLTFTPGDWNIPQTVTITGVDDDIDDGDIAYNIVLDPAVSTDPNYDMTDPADPGITNIDDDTAGFTISPVSADTTEAGGTADFTVALDSEPTVAVTIAVSSSDITEGTVSTALLTFTAGDWNIPQTVTIAGVDDDVDDGDVAFNAVLDPAGGGDPVYTGMDPDDPMVTNINDDVAGISVGPVSGDTTEAGGTADFSVVLDSEPADAVTIGISSSDTSEGTVPPASLVFDAGNWNIPQTVTITGVDDDVDDGDIAYDIILVPASSIDSNYSGMNPPDLSLENIDDDTANIAVGVVSGNTTEAGVAADFTVVLESEPTDDVSLAIESLDTTEGTVNPTGMIFSASTWDIPQTVTITGVDDDVDDGDIAYAVNIGPAESSDPNYSGMDPPDPAVTNVDDDTMGITISPPSGDTAESGTSVTFTVRLDSEPTETATIPVSSSNTNEGTVAPASLVFTNSNWNVDQVVTATGVEDGVIDGDQPYSIILGTVVGGDYEGTDPPDVALVNREFNDPPQGVDDSYSTPEESELTIEAPGVLSNDADPNGNAMTAVLSATTTNGELVLNADGSFTYTPDLDFFGTDSFVYIATDTADDSLETEVTITVSQEIDAPQITQGTEVTVAMDEDAHSIPFSLTLDATDVDFDSLTWSVSVSPGYGQASVDPSGNTVNVDYTPNTNFAGTDEFQIEVSDGTLTDTVLVIVTVDPVNDAPSVNPNVAIALAPITEELDPAANRGTAVSVFLAPSTAGDPITDPDAGALEGIAVTGADMYGGTWQYDHDGDGVFTQFPANLSVGNALLLDGNAVIRFDPVDNFNGLASFTLQGWDQTFGTNGDTNVDVSENGGTTAFSSESNVAQVNVAPVNDTPEITGQTELSFPEDEPFVIFPEYLEVSDPDGNYPTGYTLTVHEGQNYTVERSTVSTPVNYSGTLEVRVSVNDGSIDSSVYAMNIEILNMNDPPVITSVPTESTLEDEQYAYQIAVNDPDGDVQAYEVQKPDWLAFEDRGDGLASLSGTPGNDDVGFYEISIVVTDPDGESDTQAFTLEVVNVNDPPVIVSQNPLSTPEEIPATVEPEHLIVEDPDNEYPDEFTMTLLDRSAMVLPEETGVTSAVLGDVNGDGRIDLVIGTSGRPDRLYLNDSDGNLLREDAGMNITSESVDTEGLFMIDEDLDGDQDVIGIDTGGNYILYRNAGGVFDLEEPSDSVSFSNMGRISFGDINGDGLTDMLMTGDGVIRMFMSDSEFRNPFYLLEGNTVTPVLNYSGVITVPVLVNDGTESGNLWPLEIEVTPLNDQPLILGQKTLEIGAGETEIDIEITDLSVFDPDSAWPNEFTYEIHPGSNYQQNGTTVIPDEGFTGTLAVPVTVRDAQMMSNQYDLEILVGAGGDTGEEGVIAGTLLYPDDAVPGSPVRIDVFSESPEFSDSTTVEFEGDPLVAYSFSGLPPSDDYIVAIYPDSYMIRYYDGSEYGTAISENAVYVSPDSAVSNSVSFRLDTGVTVSGTVFGDRTGEIRVEAWPVGEGLPKGVTAEIGRGYSIGGLEREWTYKIVAWERDMAPFFYSAAGTVRLESLASEISLDQGDRTNVDIMMTTDENISGTVRSEETGMPVPLVWVDAWSETQQTGIGMFTGDDGTYEIMGLPSGTDYIVSVRPDIFLGYEPGERAGIASGTSNVDFLLTAVLGHEISGEVTDSRGNTVSNVDVEISSDSAGFYGWNLEFKPYLIQGLPDADDFVLTARPEDAWHAIYAATDVSIREDAVFDISLEQGYTIRGTVYEEQDDGSRKPVPGVTVIAVSESKNIREEADSNREGVYEIPSLPAAGYTLTAVSERHLESGKDATVSEGLQFDVIVDFVLETRGKIFGKVTDSGGEPVSGVLVEAYSESMKDSDGYGEFTETDAEGNWEISGLRSAFPSGGLVDDYTVATYPEDHLSQTLGGHMVGDEVNFTVAACGDTTIYGVARDSSGDPVAGVEAAAIDRDGNFVRTGITGDNGVFSIPCLQGGDHHMMFTMNGDEQWADSDGAGFVDPNPESGGVPADAGLFAPGDKFDFSFAPTGNPRAARDKEKTVQNLKSLTSGDITNDPRIVVEWEATSEDTVEETYYYKYNDESSYKITKRNAPKREAQKTRKAASLDLKIEGEKVGYYFHVAPLDSRGRIGETSTLGFLIDTVPPANANVSEIVQVYEVREGTFIDSPVSGLAYRTETLSDTTDSEGKFGFLEGENIRFAIRDVILGEAPAKALMTPIDLVDGATDETHPTVTNICRFIQSLDEDGDLENGISITDAVAGAVAGKTVNFARGVDEFGNDAEVLGILDELNTAGEFSDGPHSLATAESAQAHLRTVLESQTRRSKNKRDGTRSGYITLLLGVTGATEMYVSNINYGEGGKWEKYTKIKNWKLPDGGGTHKYIYVQFRDRAKNTTNVLFTRSLFKVLAEAGEGGSVTPSGESTVDGGDSHTVTATPDTGYEIETVTVNGKPAELDEDSSYTFENVERDHSISVSFSKTSEETETDSGGGGGGCFVESVKAE